MNLEKVEKRGCHKSVKKLKQKNKTLEETIGEFHCAVSEGPLFICTCCDQLGFYYIPGVLCQCPQADPRLSVVEYVDLVQTRASINTLSKTLFN